MATIRELDDPLTISLQRSGQQAPRIVREPGMSLVEHVVTRAELSPTDYALAWAVTFYLANKEHERFVAYLQELSDLPPSRQLQPADHLADFREHFGADLAQLDRQIGRFLARLKNAESLQYYAVLFEQPIGPNVVRRAALVSQSPAMILQWVETSRTPRGGVVSWRAVPFSTRARALLMAEDWMNRSR